MVYINGVGSVSIQNSIVPEFPDWGNSNYLRCQEPEFSKFISPVVSRRMSRIIKRSIVSSLMCLQDAQCEMPDAIISGTGLGCMEETEKFLLSMIEQKEQFLQPTHFIQSTHNTISSQIAMFLKCYNYNNTYSHLGTSFESALLDAFLQISSNQFQNALVGGFDEMTPDYKNMLSKIGYLKNEPYSFEDIRKAKTPGSILGEGSNSIFISSEKNEHSYAEIIDIKIMHSPRNETHIGDTILEFLEKNDTDVSEINAVMLGLNGDLENDLVYEKIYVDILSKPTPFIYKHLSGEYYTSAAFGLVMMANLIQNNRFSAKFYKKHHPTNPLKKVLFHNHFQNKSHSFILLEKC
jgi:3-oxoacyl-[acyl-carrier-protein] synthase II